MKKTLHYSFCKRTSGDIVRIPDEAERVQSVSHSHITSLSGLDTVVCLREGKQVTCLTPHDWGPGGRKNFDLKLPPPQSLSIPFQPLSAKLTALSHFVLGHYKKLKFSVRSLKRKR